MKLSDYSKIELNKDVIEQIVFNNITDSGKSCYYGLVFGHVMLINERTMKAIEMYKSGRIKKLVLLGGGYGDSNSLDNHTPESHQMREIAIKNGVNPADILVEDKSTNTRENILYGIKLLDSNNLDIIMLITSEFHLKRCQAILKKILPKTETILVKALDGYHDRENWYLNNNIWNNNGKHGSGKTLVENEAKILIEGAKNGTLEDLEI